MFYGINLPAEIPFETDKRLGPEGQVGKDMYFQKSSLHLITACCFGSSVPRDLLIKDLSNVNLASAAELLARKSHAGSLCSLPSSGESVRKRLCWCRLARAGSAGGGRQAHWGLCCPVAPHLLRQRDRGAVPVNDWAHKLGRRWCGG